MTPQFVIEIKQRNFGWSCSRPLGPERVFAFKEQALRFAQQQCSFVSAEVRICERSGAEQRLVLGPSVDGEGHAAQDEQLNGERSIISFASRAIR